MGADQEGREERHAARASVGAGRHSEAFAGAVACGKTREKGRKSWLFAEKNEKQCLPGGGREKAVRTCEIFAATRVVSGGFIAARDSKKRARVATARKEIIFCGGFSEHIF